MVNFDIVSMWLPSSRGYIHIGENPRMPSMSALRVNIPSEGITSIHGDAEMLDIYLTREKGQDLPVVGLVLEMRNHFCFDYGMTIKQFFEKYQQESGKSFTTMVHKFIQNASQTDHIKYIEKNGTLHPRHISMKVDDYQVKLWIHESENIPQAEKECQRIFQELETFCSTNY